MSLLTNALRTVFDVATKKQPREPAAVAHAGSEEAVPAGEVASAAPAWKLLGAHTGVQEMAYEDHARPGVQRLFAHTPKRLLDIGCAGGAVGAGLKQAIPGLWVWGCELNPAAAQVAATRLDRVTAEPRERWSDADLAAVRSVDTVLLLDVLEHMYNPWEELEFLARELPGDAQVIVSLPNIGHYSVLQALSQGRFPYAPMGILDITHVRFFTFEGMFEMFDQTGFQVEETWILSRSPNAQIDRFPAQVDLGRLTLTVESQEEWDRLNTVQFGFRLRSRQR